MNSLFHFPEAVRRDPAVQAWLGEHDGELGAIAKFCFQTMRDCGDDVRELMHDGRPTACVGDAAFAYVDVFSAHVNVGFFRGSELDDPGSLLQGTGKLMRHVQLRPFGNIDAEALDRLIENAYSNMQDHLRDAS